ncbi:MAG: hypothetical protein WD356_09345 [Pseudomonadales bacterium]
MDNSAYDMTPYSGSDGRRSDQVVSPSDLVVTANSGSRRRLAETLHPVWSVDVFGAQITFEKPIVFKVIQEGPHFVAENTYLDLTSIGESVPDALSEALEDLAHFYEHYAGLKEDEVVGFGAILRQRFRSLTPPKEQE